MEQLEIKTYDKLPAAAAEIRREVFIEEQGFALEFDEIDDISIHIVGFLHGEPIGTCRVFGDGRERHVGRIAVRRSARGSGAGSAMLSAAESVAAGAGARSVVLLAQVAARAFYEKNGYVARGGIVYDESVPHVEMVKSLGGA